MEDLQVFRKNEFVDSLFGENAWKERDVYKRQVGELLGYKYTHDLLNTWYIQQNNSSDIYSQYNTCLLYTSLKK